MILFWVTTKLISIDFAKSAIGELDLRDADERSKSSHLGPCGPDGEGLSGFQGFAISAWTVDSAFTYGSSSVDGHVVNAASTGQLASRSAMDTAISSGCRLAARCSRSL